MSGNTFGKLFTVTTFGESHGPALGAIVDGCPPGIAISEEDLQGDLDRRRPGSSRHTTQRKEPDQVRILSGVFEGKTTGTSIGLLIENTDQRSKDYSKIKDQFRPAHADYTYHHKYGHRDYRGGGRSSARETAMRVAAGAIAKKVLAAQGIQIRGYMSQLGPIKIEFKSWEAVDQNAFVVGLRKVDGRAAGLGMGAAHLLDIREGGRAVNLGLPCAQQVEVRTVENEDPAHVRFP